jgi:glycerophosphoryl diester phosphodiesterase
MAARWQTGVSAHRGDNYEAPENTLPAFELAIQRGAHQIEFDLRTTRDGHIVVLHDPTVDRTTDGTGAIADLSLAEVKALDAGGWKARRWAGTRVPTFDEVLAVLPPGLPTNCQLYLPPSSVPEVVAAIQRHDRLGECFLAAGAAHIEAARQVEPRLRVCNLEGQRSADSDYPDRTIAMGAELIQIWGWSDQLPAAVAKLHAHQVTVNFYGTADPELMRRLIEARVDYVLTDHLAAMLAVLAEYGIPPARWGR